MNFIPAYLSYAFLEDVVNNTQIDFLNPDETINNQTRLKLVDLIFHGLTVYIDEDHQKIDERIEAENGNPLLKYLIKNSRIKYVPNNFSELRTEPMDLIKKQQHSITFFGLSKNMNGILNEYQNKSGHHFLTIQSDISQLFKETIKSFERDDKLSWTFASNLFEPHNCLIVADVYLFENLDCLYELLRQIINYKLEQPYILTLIGKSNNITELQVGNRIDTFRKRLIRFNIIVEYHICNRPDFHDRYIISNNTCVFSGYGIDLIRNNTKVVKESTWTAFTPFKRLEIDEETGVFFYKILTKKLQVFKKWISSSSSPNSSNPLLIALEKEKG